MLAAQEQQSRRIKTSLLQEEIRQREKQLREDRGSDPADEHLSHSLARLLMAVGVISMIATGHVLTIFLQILLKAQEVQVKDPGVGAVLATQRGFQSLGSWARPTAFALGVLLLLVFTLRPSFQNSESPTRPSTDWRGWALAIGLTVVPFFDFNTAGGEIGLPTGIGVACGLGWISIGIGRSETLREVFRLFHRPWFGILMSAAAAGLILGGMLMGAPAFSLLGVLVASCFSLQLMAVGLEKIDQVKKWEQDERELAQWRIDLEKLYKEEAFEQELHEFLQWRDEEES